MSFLKTNSITKITGVFILIATVFTIVSQEKWNKPNAIINGDVRGYYAYLPAVFIHNDLKFENPEVYKIDVGYSLWISDDQKGHKFIKFSCGMSMMYSPFFLVSHALAEPLGAEANGFTWPYKVGLIISCLFYLLIGLIFLSKFLLRYFEDRVVSIALLIIFLGTNLFEFETGLMTYSHAYSFTLIALFLFATVKWFDAPKVKWAIWMGISAGLMFLIRPIDIIFLSFILLFNVNSFRSLKERFLLLWKYKSHALLFVGLFILMSVPQLLYFKYIFGHFFHYSYSEEGFFFLQPHLYDSMLSYRNGWLIYSPIMAFALIGFFFRKHFPKQFRWFSPFAFLVYFYVIASWWCWWYVGFGNRAFINLYPILAIPLCAFIAYILSKKSFVKIAFHFTVLGLLILNIFQSFQFENGTIHWGYMTKEAYWDAFGRTEPSQLQRLYLAAPHLNEAMLGKDVVSVNVVDTLSTSFNGFETLKSTDTTYLPFLQKNEAFHGENSLFLGSQPFALGKSINIPNGTNYVYISAWVKSDAEIRVVITGDEFTPFYAVSGQIEETRVGWKKIHLFAGLSKPIIYEKLNYYFWNEENGDYYIDDLEVHCFRVTSKTVEL